MRFYYSIIPLMTSSLVVASDSCPSGNSDLTVRTSSGSFRGFVDPKVANVNQWLGIPYGSPPIHDKRFMPPEPAKYSGAHDATAYKPICFQDSTIGQGVFWELVPQFQNTDPQSEDCLYLNIWAPRKPVDSALATTKKVPVIIWGMLIVPGTEHLELTACSLWRWFPRGGRSCSVPSTRSLGTAYANPHRCNI